VTDTLGNYVTLDSLDLEEVVVLVLHDDGLVPICWRCARRRRAEAANWGPANVAD
jgi:hypothetical protein